MKKYLTLVFALIVILSMLASCQRKSDLKCDQCGEPLDEVGKFCKNCGYAIAGDDKEGNKENNKRAEIASAYINHLKTGGEFGKYYCFYDIDGDRSEELIIRAGICEADSVILIYKYDNGNIIQLGSTHGGHCNIYGINNEAGIIVSYGHQGVENADKITVNKNSLNIEELFPVRKVEEYTEIPNSFELFECPINDMSILVDAGGVDSSDDNTHTDKVEEAYNHDTRVIVGMSKSQIEKIWGSPYMSKVKSASDGYVTYCWYYDSYGENRFVVYYSTGVAGAITPDYAELEKYFD